MYGRASALFFYITLASRGETRLYETFALLLPKPKHPPFWASGMHVLPLFWEKLDLI